MLRPVESNNALRVGIGHLFAMGRNPDKHHILHIGGVRFFSDKDPEEKDWVLKTGKHITRRLYNKTGVSNTISNQSPVWTNVRREVISFFGNLDILFVFNADNQREWFQEVIFQDVNSPVIIDILEMTQFFLPGSSTPYTEEGVSDLSSSRGTTKGKYRLPNVIRGLTILINRILEAILFRRSDGDQIAYSLFKEALRVENPLDDFLALLQVATQASQIRWEEGLGMGNLEVTENDILITDENLSEELQSSLPRYDRSENGEKEEVKAINVDSFIESQRRIIEDIPSFKERPEQQKFARFCAEAINKKGFYAIEAGTGTGKTLGYLLPACEYVRINPGRKALIASSTKNLMDQIVKKDWENVIKEIRHYEEIQIAILKGKNNYLCISALIDIFKGPDYAQGDASFRLAWLYLFMVFQNNQGRWEGLPLGQLTDRLPDLRGLARNVNAEEVCVRGVCTLGINCAYLRSVQIAKVADVVVTNHHKLSLLESRDKDDEPEYDVCIIDEADQFADNMRSALRKSLSTKDLEDYLRRLQGSGRRRGFLQVLQESKKANLKDQKDQKEARILDDCIHSIKGYCALIAQQIDDIGGIEQFSDKKRWQKFSFQKRKALQKALEDLGEYAGAVGTEWQKLLKSSRYEDPETKGRQVEKKRIKLYHEIATGLKDSVDIIVSEYDSRDYVHTYEKKGRSWWLERKPFNTSQNLEKMEDLYRTIIFTSATLTVNGKLNFFGRELFGLAKEANNRILQRNSSRISSPFVFQQQVLGFIATDDITPYNYGNNRNSKLRYQKDIERWIIVLSVALYGRTLVLCTNTSEMEEMYKCIAPVLEQHDIIPLIQDGVSAAETEMFRRVEHSVLFGVDRFWTGMDFRGETLSQVIVVRLPNKNPGIPLLEHRRTYYRGKFWSEYYHPATSLRLKPGFGRLSRNEKDKGVFVILDCRLSTNPHMARHLNALPVSLDEGRSVLSVARQGLNFLKFTPEFESRNIDLEALNNTLRGSRRY